MPDSSHLHDNLLTALYTVRTQNARSLLPEGVLHLPGKLGIHKNAP